MKVKLLSRVRLFATAWTVAHQAPPSMGFSKLQNWSGVPFPSPGDLPDPRMEPQVSRIVGRCFYHLSHQVSPYNWFYYKGFKWGSTKWRHMEDEVQSGRKRRAFALFLCGIKAHRHCSTSVCSLRNTGSSTEPQCPEFLTEASLFGHDWLQHGALQLGQVRDRVPTHPPWGLPKILTLCVVVPFWWPAPNPSYSGVYHDLPH